MRRYIPLACVVLLTFVQAAGAQKLPTDQEAKALALDSLLAFNKAIAAEDFTGFHKQISALWQAQVTPAKLKSIFQTFIDQELDLSLITGVDPVFSDAPSIDSDGVLVLQGSYPATPTKVDFRLKYVNEKSAWKLIGIKVDAKPSGVAGKLPTIEEANALVRDSLAAFNAAVQTKSFVDFHKQIAVMWQKQVTPDRLAELFGGFIKAGVNIAGVARMEPDFDKPPAIDENGILELKGSYPTRPSKVMFDLAYLYEANEWKLVKINVNVQPGAEAEKPASSPAAADDNDEE